MYLCVGGKGVSELRNQVVRTFWGVARFENHRFSLLISASESHSFLERIPRPAIENPSMAFQPEEGCAFLPLGYVPESFEATQERLSLCSGAAFQKSGYRKKADIGKLGSSWLSWLMTAGGWNNFPIYDNGCLIPVVYFFCLCVGSAAYLRLFFNSKVFPLVFAPCSVLPYWTNPWNKNKTTWGQ